MGPLAAALMVSAGYREMPASRAPEAAMQSLGARRTVPIPPGPPIEDIAAGRRHTCVLQGGEVRCWGHRTGQCGETGEEQAIAGLPPAKAIFAGVDRTCAVDEALLGVRAHGLAAVPDLNLPPLVDLVVGDFHFCGRTRDDRLWCWGHGEDGQLGRGVDGIQARDNKPVEVPLADVRKVSAGAAHMCALTGDHQVYCWGDNRWGQLGFGGYSREPRQWFAGEKGHGGGRIVAGLATCLLDGMTLRCAQAGGYPGPVEVPVEPPPRPAAGRRGVGAGLGASSGHA